LQSERIEKTGIRIPVFQMQGADELLNEFRRRRERTIRKGVKNPDGERALPPELDF
jgi:hypothetical protein